MALSLFFHTFIFSGLEAFNSHPLLQSFIDKLAVGKILLMETLEPCQQNEVPVVVLYDTSQDDDVNINSMCLKTLQDMTMNNSLTVRVMLLHFNLYNLTQLSQLAVLL